jgi:alkylation response protein AidB-like acyl-CoA dehydrogenase
MLQGKKRARFAPTEPDAGSDPARMRTRALRYGDFYILDGSKLLITEADCADLAQVWQ